MIWMSQSVERGPISWGASKAGGRYCAVVIMSMGGPGCVSLPAFPLPRPHGRCTGQHQGMLKVKHTVLRKLTTAWCHSLLAPLCRRQPFEYLA